MKNDDSEKAAVLIWSAPVSLTAATKIAPNSSGVYFFGAVTRLMGLEIGVDPVYVGRSNNLKKRLAEHYRNQRDLEWRRQISSEQLLGVRWVVLPRSEIENVEISLIRTLSPKFNIINYTKGRKAA